MKKLLTKNLSIQILGALAVLLGLLVTYTPNHLKIVTETYTSKHLANMYDNSQYTVPNSKNSISDAILYAHAGYEYATGDNPLRLNAEHLTTGKYLIGFFYLLTGFTKSSGIFFVIVIFATINIFIYRNTKSFLPSFIFSLFYVVDTNIRYQIVGGPLLDIIQLFFWLVHSYTIYKMVQNKNTWRWTLLSGLSLGLMASSKMYAPALLTLFCVSIYILLDKRSRSWRGVFSIIIISTIATITYISTYVVYFLFYRGNLLDFIKSQLWILHFWTDNPVNNVKIIGAAIPLLMSNKYFVWWGDSPIIPYEDWTLVWPVATLLTLSLSMLTISNYFRKREGYWTEYKNSRLLLLLSLWIVIFFVYLLNIPISPRYFPLLFVPGYILMALVGYEIYAKYHNKKR